jgi:hypothetical protein
MKWYSLFLFITFISMSCSIFDTGKSLEENSDLSTITVMFNDEAVEFSPPFSPDVTEYSVSFLSYPRSFSLVATSEDSSATIQVNGETVESGEEIQVHTSPPKFVVEIIVTSENGENSKTYVLNIEDPMPLGDQ